MKEKIKKFLIRYFKELIIAFIFAILVAYLFIELGIPEKTTEKIAKENIQSIVLIETFDKDHKPLLQGSGFFITNDGLLVTNYHVIKDAKEIRAKLYNGAYYEPEEVKNVCKDYDIALLKFDGKDFHPVKIGIPGDLKLGEKVVAIGSPLGIQNSVSEGKISAISNQGIIQTDAAISSGSSGGALFNKKGKAVGITSAMMPPILGESTFAQNINFAIPINFVEDVIKGRISKEGCEPKEAYYFGGILSQNEGSLKQAEEFYKKAIELDENYADAYFGLAEIYYDQNLYEEMFDISKKMVEIVPENSDSHFYLAWAYENKGLYDQAIKEYQEVVRLKPDDKDAIYYLGILYIIQGKISEASSLITKLENLNPGLANELRMLINRTR